MRRVSSGATADVAISVDQALRALDEAHATVGGLRGLEGWQREAVALRDRLQTRRHTVAVFGAFSTGKSSLINALLGRPVLISSPHPTTAAVTRVSLGAADTSARVELKSEAQVWEDVRRACELLHRPAASLEAAIQQAGRIRLPDLPAAARPAGAFLQAVAAGWPSMRDKLGQTLEVPMAELRTYTAEEQTAAFVSQVDVVCQAGEADPGIVWVDTPGVDSVHRRHTEVAFDYLRHADAVVLVLYFTHAMSRAEKDFLLQWAGVQDVTGIDKLFVVINAVDLASSREEREAVRERVVQELRHAGIARPRVFEVSSQLGLAAAMRSHAPGDPQVEALLRQRLRLTPAHPLPDLASLHQQAGVEALREAITEHVSTTADAIAVDAVARSLREAIRITEQRMQQLRMAREADAKQRAALEVRREAWRAAWQTQRDQVVAGAAEEMRALEGQWKELVFHMGERIRLRLPELFKEAFYPGRFRDPATARRQLAEAAEEWMAALARQVEVEGRTYALRIASQVAAQLDRIRDAYMREALALGVMPGLPSIPSADQLADGVHIPEVRLMPQSLSRVLGHFRSARQFFEEGGARRMLDEAEPLGMAQVRDAIATVSKKAEDVVRDHLRETWLACGDAVAAALDASTTADEADEPAAYQRAAEALRRLGEVIGLGYDEPMEG